MNSKHISFVFSKRDVAILLVCIAVSLFALFCGALRYVRRIDELTGERDIWADRATHYEAEAAQNAADLSSMEVDYNKLKTAQSAISDGLTASYAGEFLCTSYDLNCGVCQTTDITYSGEAPIPGYTVAADLSVFPIGTWLYIEGLGIRRVTDTGGGVRKNQLDVLVAGNHDDAKAWTGYGYHRVWVLEDAG